MTQDEVGEGALPAPLAGIRWFDRKIQRIEVAVCLGSLALMVFLAFTQVFLRMMQGSFLGGIFPAPVPWFENIARYMVIWVGLLGASVATAEGRHISIEALPKLLGPKGQRRVDAITSLASLLVVVTMLIIACIYFYRLQLEPWLEGEAEVLFTIGLLGLEVPHWPFLLVVPVGLLLISWRLGLRLVEAIALDDETYTAVRKQDEQHEMEEVDEHQQEAAVEMLTDHARRQAEESGAQFTLDQETARSEIREAMGASNEPEDLLAGPESESDERPNPIPSRRRPLSLRSTDEIPTYQAQDLHDDEDVRDPVMRKGEVILDSTDMLDVSEEEVSPHAPTPDPDAEPALASDVEDIRFSDDDPDAAVEAVADSERRKESERRKQEALARRGDDPTAVTDRVPVEMPPPSVPANLVVIVRPRGDA